MDDDTKISPEALQQRTREREAEEARLYRENREGFYESVSRNVGRYETMRDGAISSGVSYAQIGLRSAFLLNGGAIGLVLPALGTTGLLTIQSLQLPALAFVLGIFLAALCSVFAFLNFDRTAAYQQSRANEMQKIVHRSYFPDPSVSNDDFTDSLEVFRTEQQKYHDQAHRLYVVALSAGVLSFIAFMVGSLLLIFGAEATPPSS